jgi:peptidoglycan/LPS O-acetylase OafA/YrhL
MPKLETRAAGVQDARVFHTLDALRGVAAIGVVIFHMGQAFSPLATPGGYLAVDLFFMMSGVVLSHAYESRFRSGMGTLQFMRVRLIRLYPLYLLGVLFGIAVTVASMLGRNSVNWDASSLLTAIFLALLFLPNFSGRPVDTLFPLNIPCWSLFLELVVNGLFALFWPLLTARRLVVTCLLSGIVVGGATLHAGHIDQGSTAATIAIGLARTIFGFCAGMLIARHAPHSRRRESNPAVLAIMAAVAVAIIGWPEGLSRAIWDIACVLVLFPVVVYCGTLIDPGAQLRRLATFLGLTSYAVYVLHSPASSVLNSATRFLAAGNGAGIGAPWLGLAMLATLLLGAFLVDRYYDTPARRLLARILPAIKLERQRPP